MGPLSLVEKRVVKNIKSWKTLFKYFEIVFLLKKDFYLLCINLVMKRVMQVYLGSG